ncbi:outer membrane protein with beta-barrel domain [Neolewinella xylanilytica]|uniref:Outer membrane protein with beta-barrel domain n=1 Tax=Neolewinella xylanilytica TaxID=1514080 RepID=A0A2S6I2Q9_9BACT|nr:DUF6089 family protein [Neolewinella xylanilytica]PPK85455.1 outer membrane protein with beta-barrel domain [Neolewinella xylanilytica]
MRQTIFLFFFALVLFNGKAAAQLQMRGLEVGPWLGAAFYLGDLNTEFRFNRPRPAGGIAARYNFNHRLAARASLNYGRLFADDSDSRNTFEQRRNLNFVSNVFDFTGQFEFNFLPYYHGSSKYPFTPYAFAGFSAFTFNPQGVTSTGETIKLQRLGTEGQPIGDEYHRVSLALAYGIGFRWDLTYELSMDASLSLRNTATDYLDDVSTVYPDLDVLRERRPNSNSARMSDRGLPGPDGERIDRTGTQRGDSTNNDHYIFLGIGINYYFGDVLCPKVFKGRKIRVKKVKERRN